MKRSRIVQAAVLVVVMAILASCGSTRQYPDTHSRTQVGFSLILNPSPSYVVYRHPDGRYYYRSSNGYVYWRGNDRRYYLDNRYVTKKYYQHNQYRDWRQNRGSYRRRR